MEELRSAYQPIINLKENIAIGYEALLRGDSNPESMFRTAAQTDTIFQLDAKALELSIQGFQTFTQKKDTKLFVNCHPITFINQDFLRKMQHLSQEIPNPIVIEITEQAQLPIEAMSVAMALKDMGIAIAIDDFGVGKSNIHYIELLEPSYIKLDKSIIRNVVESEKVRCLILGLVEMSRAVSAELIAEGVETQEIATIIENCGVNIAQGWYLGYPSFYPIEHRSEVLTT